ncbi:hypothetical protein R2G56_21050, partial [Nitratireductor aquimarinus]
NCQRAFFKFFVFLRIQPKKPKEITLNPLISNDNKKQQTGPKTCQTAHFRPFQAFLPAKLSPAKTMSHSDM